VSPSRVAAAFRRRPKFNIIAFTVTVLIAVAALEIADLWWRRDRALKTAETRATSIVIVLAEYIRGSFASADAALRQLQLHGRRVGGSSASKEDWDPMLAAAKAALPESGSLTVTDASGIIRHSTQRAIIGQSRSDEVVFKQLSTATADDLVVGLPFPALTTPVQHVVPLGRRLVTAAGAFDGTIVASVIPERYREFFATIEVGREGAISVLHPHGDGTVLFRAPSATNPIDEPERENVLLKLARERGAGVFHGPLVNGGPHFISAYRTIGTPALIVAVSLSERDVLADWRSECRVAAAAFGALTLALALMVVVLFRTVNARERVERELAAVQRLEAERLRDTNERLAAALEREQRARKEVETASYLKDEFLMTVSHELRTPLTAIYGWARVLNTREMPKEEQARAIAAIERNAHAQTRLIDDLLDVSRAISGKLRLEPRTINVAEVLRAAVETMSPAMAAKGIRFEAEYDPQTPPILADPDRLQQIAWNLLSNATKFTPEHGAVNLRLSHTDTQVEITVADTGSGIDAEFLPHVFERFRQADVGSRRRYGGLGLGLAIVRHLVELHGGTVTAESAGRDQGATFRVRLPVGIVTNPAEPAIEDAASRPSPHSFSGSR
jgi:signal transduction histidine kinase